MEVSTNTRLVNMFNLKKLLFNPNLSNVISLLIDLSLSIFLGFYLLKGWNNHAAVSTVISALILLIGSIFEVALKCYDIIKSSPDKEIDKKAKNQLFSQKWYSENFPSIVIMIMGISVMIIVLSIVTINDGWTIWTTTYVVSDPKFDTIRDWAFILFGVYFWLNSLKKVLNFQEFPNFNKALDSKLLNLLQDILLFSAFIMYMIYGINLTEVP